MRVFVASLGVLSVLYFWDQNYNNGKLLDGLVLLRHKFLRGMFLCIGVAQHGHRDNLLARATLRRMRSVAMGFGGCGWVWGGGASGSVTVGNRKFLEPPHKTRATHKNPRPLGDQKPGGGDAQRGVVVEAAPP